MNVLVEFSISSKVEESARSVVGTSSESVSVREEAVEFKSPISASTGLQCDRFGTHETALISDS